MIRVRWLLLALLVGDLVLAGMLRGHNYALMWLGRDTTGEWVGTAPGPDWVARAPQGPLDYRIRFRRRIQYPPATGRNGGLDDVRNAIRWVRQKLNVGDDYHASTWWLYDVVQAASDGRHFLCDTYARALAAVSMRQGYPARVVMLQGHIATEIYLPAYRNWVFADAIYDFIAEDAGGHPLSILETADRVSRGQPVLWQSVVGRKGDDDVLDAHNMARLDSLLRLGNFEVDDGAAGFNRLTKLERLRDLLRGRVHVVQIALRGQPRFDRIERTLRALILVWNVALLASVLAVALRRRPARPSTAG